MRRVIAMTLLAAVAALGSPSARQSGAPATVRFTYGGNGTDTINAVTTDAVGNIYIAGRTTSRDLPGTERAFQKELRGDISYAIADGFVAKLDPTGRVIWASYLGGNDARARGAGKYPGQSADEVRAMGVDAAGNVYVAGTTSSTDFPTTPDAFQPDHLSTAANTYDGFLAKFNAGGGELLYSTYIGVPDASTAADAIAVTGNGDTWVLVSTASAKFPWTQDVSGGRGAAFLGHFPARGASSGWTRVGTGADAVGGLALDRLARPHVLTHRPTGSGGLMLTQLEATDTRANFTWSLPLEVTAPASRATTDLAIGPDGTIVIVGLASSALPVAQPFQGQPGGGGDAFVAVLNPVGTVEVLSYLGGSGAEPTRPRVAVDADRRLHIALDTGSFDLRTERGVIPRHPDSPVYTSDDQGRSWKWSGAGLTSVGRVMEFASDARRGIVYTVVDGRLLRSTDRGASWQEVRRFEAFAFRSHLAIDPRDPSTLYAGDRNLYRLDGGGETVTQLREATAGVGGFGVYSVAVSPHDGSVWVGSGNGVEVSVDRGANWEHRDNGLPSSAVGRILSPTSWAFDPARAGKIAIAMDSGVFGTEDHGRSWRELTGTLTYPGGFPERPYVETVALDPADPRRIYAGTFNRGIIVSDDSGGTWRRAAPLLAVAGLTVDPRPPHDVFAAVTDFLNNRVGVLVSRDRGKTWTWSLQTRDRPTAIAADRQTVLAAGPTNVAPYVVRLDWRQSSYAPSFASYLMEGPARAIATTPLGDTVVVLQTVPGQIHAAIVRIAR